MITSTAGLLQQRSIHATDALGDDEAARLLPLVPGWTLGCGTLAATLQRTFTFKNYHHTMAFANALAFLSHAEDHHPELTLTYQHCTVRYTTHSVNQGRGGLSTNDFICAAKASALFDQAAGTA